MYTYNLPGALKTSVFEGQSLKTRPNLQPRQGSFWVPGIYRIDYMPLQRSPSTNRPTPINHLWG